MLQTSGGWREAVVTSVGADAVKVALVHGHKLQTKVVSKEAACMALSRTTGAVDSRLQVWRAVVKAGDEALVRRSSPRGDEDSWQPVVLASVSRDEVKVAFFHGSKLQIKVLSKKSSSLLPPAWVLNGTPSRTPVSLATK